MDAFEFDVFGIGPGVRPAILSNLLRISGRVLDGVKYIEIQLSGDVLETVPGWVTTFDYAAEKYQNELNAAGGDFHLALWRHEIKIVTEMGDHITLFAITKDRAIKFQEMEIPF